MIETEAAMTDLEAEMSETHGSDGAGSATMDDPHQQLRLLEALLFAVSEPLDEATLAERLPDGADIPALMAELSALYANRGVQVVQAGSGWAFRTAADLAPYLKIERSVSRALSPAAIETLAIVAYHQPVTRAEIEEIRGKSLSKGTLDVLLQAGWIRPKGRRQTPGRPVTWGTSDAFLDHFGLQSLQDLPGVEELKAAGLLDSRPAITAYGAIMRGEEQVASGEAGAEETESESAEDAEEASAWDDPQTGGEDIPEDSAAAESGLEISEPGTAEDEMSEPEESAEGDEDPRGTRAVPSESHEG